MAMHVVKLVLGDLWIIQILDQYAWLILYLIRRELVWILNVIS